MIIKKKTMLPAPEGEHAAVCVDVTPVELKDTPWGKKPKFQLRWEIDARQPDGDKRPFLVVKQYTASLDKKSNLRKDLKAWRTRDFTDEELRGFDMEKLIGVPCRLIVTHNNHEGEVYANVETVLRAGDVKMKPSGKYTRVQDRPDYKPAASSASGDEDMGPPPNDDDVPADEQQEPDCPF